MQHKAGHWIWVLDRGKVMTWTEGGKPLMMFGTHTEITNLKEAKTELGKSKAFLDTVINSIDEGIVVCDQNGKLTTFNQSAAEMQGIPFKPVEPNQTAINFAGVEPHDLIGKKFWDCYWWTISKETQETLKANIEKAAKGEFV